MTKLAKLKKEALEACKFRGHKMGKWERNAWWDKETTYCSCGRCGKGVQVNVKPPANGINIGGEAVVTECNKESSSRVKEIRETHAKKRSMTGRAGQSLYPGVF